MLNKETSDRVSRKVAELMSGVAVDLQEYAEQELGHKMSVDHVVKSVQLGLVEMYLKAAQEGHELFVVEHYHKVMGGLVADLTEHLSDPHRNPKTGKLDS